jgi:hypothetical protein
VVKLCEDLKTDGMACYFAAAVKVPIRDHDIPWLHGRDDRSEKAPLLRVAHP